MKKFFKFIGGLVSVAAVSFGAYCVYKKVVEFKESDEKDDEDLFEDEDLDENTSDREYVSIHITGEEENPLPEEKNTLEEEM